MLEEVIRLIHLLLVDDLDRHVLARLDVRGQLYESEFAVPKRILDFVILKDVAVAHCLLHLVHPDLLVSFVFQVVNTFFVTWVNDLERVQLSLRIQFLDLLVGNENAHQRIHLLVGSVILVLIDVQFDANKGVKIFFELALWVLSVHVALMRHLVLIVVHIK